MSNQAGTSMQAVASAAAIAQEKITKTVTFALTGDTETDFIAAVLTCFEAMRIGGGSWPFSSYDRTCQRVCEYLAMRFKAQAETSERQHDDMLQRMTPKVPEEFKPQMHPLPYTSSGVAASPPPYNFPYTTGGVDHTSDRSTNVHTKLQLMHDQLNERLDAMRAAFCPKPKETMAQLKNILDVGP